MSIIIFDNVLMVI